MKIEKGIRKPENKEELIDEVNLSTCRIQALLAHGSDTLLLSGDTDIMHIRDMLYELESRTGGILKLRGQG